MTAQEELLQLNDDIEVLEDEYVDMKLEFEIKKAKLLLETDFATAIGKAKPTVAEKDAYVKLQTVEDERAYKQVGVTIGAMKRKLDILSGDD